MGVTFFVIVASCLLPTLLISETEIWTPKSADSLHSPPADFYHFKQRMLLEVQSLVRYLLFGFQGKGTLESIGGFLNNDPLSYDTSSLPSIMTIKFKLNGSMICNSSEYGSSVKTETVKINCSSNFTGYMEATCGENAVYEEEKNFCVSPEFSKLKQMVADPKHVAANLTKLLHTAANIMNLTNATSLGNMVAMGDILESFSKVKNVSVDASEVENFMTVMSFMTDKTTISNWNIIKESNTEKNRQSQMLESLERFTQLISTNESSIEITTPNIQLKGLKVHSDENNSFNVTFRGLDSNNISGTAFIDKSQYAFLPKNSFILSIASATMVNILSPKRKDHVLNSLILTTTTKNSSVKIEMRLQLENNSLDSLSAECVFWNFSEPGWDDKGCSIEIQKGYAVCKCNHLTSYSVMMSPFTPENNRALDLISLIGIGMSIGSLIISIIIEAITWKYLTKNKTSYIRNVVILNIIVSLLMANGLTAVPLFVHPTPLYCTILTFLKHFFFLALFFWKLSLGLLLLYHLIFVFHDFSISVITTMCFIVGYLCPIIIASITIALTYPKNQYNLQKECWLEWKNRKVLLAFVGPMSAIIAINICIVLVAICKLLRPTIGEHSKYHSKGSFKQILRSVVILTPVLGLTWIIGFPNLSKDSGIIFHYLFSAINGLQGFLIFIICFVIDKKVHEALRMRFPFDQNPYVSKLSQSTSEKSS